MGYNCVVLVKQVPDTKCISGKVMNDDGTWGCTGLCDPDGLPVLLLLATSIAHAVEVRDVRLWRAPDHTRIVFDLTAPAEHKLMVLENPDRIVVDVSDTALKSSFSGLKLDDTPVKSIRSGVRDGDDLRVVFDMNDRVNPRSFALKANAQAGDRLVIDLETDGTIDPEEAIRFWEKMSAQKNGAPPEFLSTHPSDATRIAQLKREIALLKSGS